MLEDVSIQFSPLVASLGSSEPLNPTSSTSRPYFSLPLFGDFSHILLRAVDYADFNVFGIAATLIASCQQQTRENQSTQSKFHKTYPFDERFSDYIDNEAVK